MSERSWVYFIHDGWSRVKIGWSVDVDKRLASLQSANAEPLTLLRVLEGGPATERWLHRRFAAERLHGEWFSYHEDMLTVVPPDEIPVRQAVRPVLRQTLREALVAADESGMFAGRDRLLAVSLAAALWDDDARDFIAWVRERCGVPAPEDPEPGDGE